MPIFQTRNDVLRLVELRQKIQQESPASGGPGISNNTRFQWTLDADRESIRQALGRSFAGSSTVKGEPTFEWGLKHVTFSNQEEKVQTIRFMVSYMLFKDWRDSSFQLACIAAEDGDGADKGQVISFVSVVEYNALERAKRPNLLQKIGNAWNELISTFRLKALLKEPVPPLFRMEQRKEERQKIDAKLPNFEESRVRWHEEAGPKGWHWYVHLVGVVPEHQGLGRGTEILQLLNALADEKKRAMYLECGDNNKQFYENLGFLVVRSQHFSDPENPDDAYQIHLMTREPKVRAA